MTWYFDVYGSRHMNIDELARAVSAALETPFKQRDSLVKGEYYTADIPGRQSIEVRPNFVNDYGEETIMEEDFADRPVLLYVYCLDCGPGLERVLTKIPGLELLRRETRPD
jgi:hypothetical protein